MANSLALSPQIPFVRLDNADPELFEELMAATRDVASRGAFTLGPEVERFEREFADYCGASEAIGISSGTEALALALRGLGIGRGDEVIVPTNSFIATAEAVTLAGAEPRFVDVDPATGLLTADGLAAAIGARTAAAMPVHLHGATADMDAIMAVAERAGIAIVEDACQAHGAWIGERRAGAVGHAGCFSFYPTKNLGGWGDGGAVTTNDSQLAERIRLLRAHGERPDQRHRHVVAATTARLDALQAALLSIKLRRLDGWNQRRRELAAAFGERLAAAAVQLPSGAPSDHVHHVYVVRCDDRDGLRTSLADEGIATAIHYPHPIHLQEAYEAQGLGEGSLPVAEQLAGRILSLPFSPYMLDEEVERVADAVTRARERTA